MSQAAPIPARLRDFSRGDVARVFGVSIWAVIKWCDGGRLRCYKVPGSRFRRITVESLVEFARTYDPVMIPVIREYQQQELGA
jgi:hypothetical protein